MLVRLFRALVLSAVAVLLFGCAQAQYKPPGQRNPTPFKCTTSPCVVTVDPRSDEWVPENIEVNRGGVIHFVIRNNVAPFADAGIRFKTADGRRWIPCHRTGQFRWLCNVDREAPRDLSFEYGINVRGFTEYDPFVWTR